VQTARCHSVQASLRVREKFVSSDTEHEPASTPRSGSGSGRKAALPVGAGTAARTATFHSSTSLARPSSLLTPGKKVAARTGIIPAKRTLIVLPTWVRARHSAILLLFTTTTTLRLRYAPSTTYLRYLCQFYTALDSPSLPKYARLLQVGHSPKLLLPASNWLLQLHYDPPRASSSSIQLLIPKAPFPFSLDPHQHLWPACAVARTALPAFVPHNQTNIARPLRRPFQDSRRPASL
jgi:hypothetical protein